MEEVDLVFLKKSREFLALPKAWPTGKVTGLCARGGFEVEMSWEDGRLTQALIHSKSGLPCKVVCGNQSWKFNTKAGKSYPLRPAQKDGPRSINKSFSAINAKLKSKLKLL